MPIPLLHGVASFAAVSIAGRDTTSSAPSVAHGVISSVDSGTLPKMVDPDADTLNSPLRPIDPDTR